MKIRRMMIKIGITLFTMALAVMAHGDNEGRSIKILREVAGRLGWSQDIFVGVKNPGEDVQILGVSNMPFSLFSVATEKSFIQWLLGHKWSLERVLERHLESYRELNFKVVPIEGLGQRAYRAVSFSYVADEAGDLILSRSQDIIEVFQDNSLITVRDEKLNLDANAWAIFKEVYQQVLQEKVDREQNRLIYPIPRRLKEVTWPRDAFSTMPVKIQMSAIPPDPAELPYSISNWQITDRSKDFQLGQAVSLGKNYTYHSEDDQNRAPKVDYFLYAYGSSGEAQLAFQIYRNRFESKKIKNFEKEGEDAFWVSGRKGNHLRMIFMDHIFLCEIRVHWNEAGREDRKGLLRRFVQITKTKIQQAFENF